jgi:hypothetical protein
LLATISPHPKSLSRGRGTLNLAPFSLGRRVGDEGLGMQQRLFDLVLTKANNYKINPLKILLEEFRGFANDTN